MATLQERIREYLGSQADTPAARSLAQKAESMYADELGAALGGPVGAAVGAVAGRGASTPAEREYLNQVLKQTRQGPGANVPRFDQYLGQEAGKIAAESMQGRGMDTPAEREFLREAIPSAPVGGGMAQGIPTMAGRGMDTPREREFLSNTMTPAQRQDYFQSFTDAGLNLTPGAGFARGLRGIDQAVTNATTAPGNLGVNQLSNIASGQSNVSPYGLGLGQQMYMNPMGLLNY